MLDINYNGVTLAYIGDAVIELFVREALISSGITDTGRLSAAAQKLVCAKAQSEIAEILLPLLSEEETAAYKLGRNHHVSGKPKHASVAQYSRATGVEAIFGYLHLIHAQTRVKELFDIAFKERISALKETL